MTRASAGGALWEEVRALLGGEAAAAGRRDRRQLWAVWPLRVGGGVKDGDRVGAVGSEGPGLGGRG